MPCIAKVTHMLQHAALAARTAWEELTRRGTPPHPHFHRLRGSGHAQDDSLAGTIRKWWPEVEALLERWATVLAF